MLKFSLILLAGVALTACATDDLAVNSTPPPVTPTERYAIEVTQHPEELKLAPHAQGVSQNQADAIGEFVQRWTDHNGGVITLRSPSHAGDPQAAYRTTEDARDVLVARGVDPGRIHIVSYDAGGEAQAPVVIGYSAYVAHGPQCGQEWDNMTATGSNREYANFGCAITANMAAQIGNPGDIVSPRPMDPSDAARRQAVLDHYRKGEQTSSVKDDQASGAVSTAVH